MFNKKDEGISDLAEICTKEKADEGVWIQAVLFGKKQNFEVKIFGDDSDVVHEYTKRKAKEQMKKIRISRENGGADIDLDDDNLDEILEDSNEPALIRFGGIRKTDGTPLKFNGDDFPVEKTDEKKKLYDGLLCGSPALKDFIMNEAKKRANFFSVGKKN
jgi:hypothetical protein